MFRFGLETSLVNELRFIDVHYAVYHCKKTLSILAHEETCVQ
jgi:hypothetical protein